MTPSKKSCLSITFTPGPLSSSGSGDASSELPRCSAPLSFWSHRAYMDACRWSPVLRFAIVAAMLAVGLAGVDAAGARAEAMSQGAGAAFGAPGLGVASMGAGAKHVAGSAAPVSPKQALQFAELSSVSIASCPTLQEATAPWNAPRPNPFSYNGSFSFFPQPSRSDVAHAKWEVYYFDTWKFVVNRVNGQQYALHMRGTQGAPELPVGMVLELPVPNAPSDFVEIKAGLKRFEVPVQRLCVEETIGLAMIEMLGLRSSITRYNLASVPPTSACVKAMADRIQPLESTWGNATRRAEQVAASCDLVLGSNSPGAPGEVKHVSFAATVEEDVLARAEWIKFIGAFFNREQAANAVFNGIRARYEAKRAAVAQQFTLSTSAATRPLVAWLSVYTYQGVTTYTISQAAYKVNVTRDAGGRMLLTDTKDYTDLANFQAALRSVDAVVDESYAVDPFLFTFDNFLAAYKFQANDTYPFLVNKRVFRLDGLLSKTAAGTVSWDWFEMGVSNADALLADLAAGLGPLTPAPNAQLQQHSAVWMRNVAAGVSPRLMSNDCSAAQMVAPLSAIEAAEAGQANDPAFIPACPAHLMQPWTFGVAPGLNAATGAADFKLAMIVAAALLAAIMAAL